MTASAIGTQKIAEKFAVAHTYSGDASTAVVCSGYVDMRDFDELLATVWAAALTGTGVTVFEIYAAATAADTLAEAIKTHAVGSAPDAAGDMLTLECSAQEIRDIGDKAGKLLRYAFLKVTCNNSADRVVGTTIARSNRARADLTTDVIA